MVVSFYFYFLYITVELIFQKKESLLAYVSYFNRFWLIFGTFLTGHVILF